MWLIRNEFGPNGVHMNHFWECWVFASGRLAQSCGKVFPARHVTATSWVRKMKTPENVSPLLTGLQKPKRQLAMSRRLGDLNVWRIHVVSADMSHSNNNVCRTLKTIFGSQISVGRLSLAIGPVFVGNATSQGPGYVGLGGRHWTSCLQLGVSAAIRIDAPKYKMFIRSAGKSEVNHWVFL